jgi:hypothetical protein
MGLLHAKHIFVIEHRSGHPAWRAGLQWKRHQTVLNDRFLRVPDLDDEVESRFYYFERIPENGLSGDVHARGMMIRMAFDM